MTGLRRSGEGVKGRGVEGLDEEGRGASQQCPQQPFGRSRGLQVEEGTQGSRTPGRLKALWHALAAVERQGWSRHPGPVDGLPGPWLPAWSPQFQGFPRAGGSGGIRGSPSRQGHAPSTAQRQPGSPATLLTWESQSDS